MLANAERIESALEQVVDAMLVFKRKGSRSIVPLVVCANSEQPPEQAESLGEADSPQLASCFRRHVAGK